MIELAAKGIQTGHGISETLAVGQLRKGHAAELIRAGEVMDLVIAAVALHARAECVPGQDVHHLSEHRASGVHEPFPPVSRNGSSVLLRSSR